MTNCTWPSPVVGGWETQTRLVDVIFKALLPALPERLPAGTKAMMCHAGFGGVDPDSARVLLLPRDVRAAATAAALASDGPDAVQAHGQNTENAPVEETELNYPVRVARLSLVEDSDGPGRFRGGLGLRKDFLFDRPTTFTVLADRTVAGPQGRLRRARGAGRASTCSCAAAWRRGFGAKTTLELQAGDVVSYRTCGGGGYGPPAERDPERVLRDVLRGKGARRARARRVPRRRAGRPRRCPCDRGAPRMSLDPIAFEVIRNALVAATDEMVLTLKRSAYSTNIKTRSDFSCAFFDAELRAGGAGVRAAGAPRLDGGAGAEGDPHVRRRAARPGRRDRHERPVPERRAPERRQPDLARARRRRAARLRREPGAPRRRRRRRAGHRSAPSGRCSRRA